MTFALVMVDCGDGDNFYLRGSSKIKLKHLYTKHIANVKQVKDLQNCINALF